MATKKEKLFGTILCSITGAMVGNSYAKNNNIPEEERWKHILGGGAGVSIGGYGMD